MISKTSMMVYGGRGADGAVLCDAAIFDATQMKWTVQEPTPFARCAHAAAALESAETSTSEGAPPGAESGTSGVSVYVFGGFSGEAVVGDLIRIDARTLEIEQVDRGPRSGSSGGSKSAPAERFAHAAVSVGGRKQFLVLGGVTPAEDLSDVAVWVHGDSS